MQCERKSGLFGGRCKLDSLHGGNHDNGQKQWPVSEIDLEIRAITIEKINEQNEARRHRQDILERHRRGEI